MAKFLIWKSLLVPAKKCSFWKGRKPVENVFHTVYPTESKEDPNEADTCPAIWSQGPLQLQAPTPPTQH